MSLTWIITVLCIIAVTLAYVAWNYIRIRKMPEGTADMVDMAAIIRSGANAFMKTEYKTISIVVVLISLTLSLFVEKTAGITFLVGAAMSSCACVLGMKSATYANVRTANKARESMSIGDTIKVALCGGSISGLSVQAFGMFGLVAVLLIWGGVTHQADGGGLLTRLQGVNASIMRVSTYSLGCSLVAMFNRVAGGNYTKAADISADILGKIRNDLPEDDSRIPNVIADFIGDNVNDIAGNCSDLLESFVATMSATIMIAVIMFEKFNIEEMFNPTVIFPVVLAGAGLLSCLTGMLYANVKKMGNDPSHELNLATWISAGLTVILGLGASWLIFGKIDAATLETYGWRASWLSPWICAVLGLASGVAIGSITEYYTSSDFKPTKKLAEMAPEGDAFVITKGDAIGSRSCLMPILLIGIALFVSGRIGGTYGIAVASLGMLAFVGTTVSIDAFGPIADNAGGLAESCHLSDKVRVITDKLDAVGNTTAAIGKGFAIGSAAFATVSLIVSYVGNYTPANAEMILNIASFTVVAGAWICSEPCDRLNAALPPKR
jgi:K(+)-stimulated pyrophosphate-energized sodium pump